MSSARPVLAALCLSFALIAGAPAAGGATAENEVQQIQPVEATEAVTALPHFLELPVEELPPRLRIIRDILVSRGAALLKLDARYQATSTDAQALIIQREIHELKQGTELALLEAQLEFAREDQDQDKVAELESVLESFHSPAGVLGPAERLAPAQTGKE